MSLTDEPRQKFLSKTFYSSKCSVSIKYVAAHFVYYCTQGLSNNFPMRMLVGLQVAIVFIALFFALKLQRSSFSSGSQPELLFLAFSLSSFSSILEFYIGSQLTPYGVGSVNGTFEWNL